MEVFLRIATWNIDGFTTEAKRLEVTQFLRERRVDIAVLTEPHLRDGDIFFVKQKEEQCFRFEIRHFKILHWRNRESTVRKIGGGVLIVARE